MVEEEECKTEILEEEEEEGEGFSRPTSLAQHLAMTVEVTEADTVGEVEADLGPGLAVGGEEIMTGTPGLTEG